MSSPTFPYQRWEYTSHTWTSAEKDGNWNEKIDELGEKGWELVNTTWGNGAWVSFFKRPLVAKTK